QELAGLLEPGVEFEGKITVSSGLIRINTHVKGVVDCADAVVVVDQGEVEGEIRSRFISVAGKVKGIIRASEKVEIKANGIVLGDIHAASIVIEPGGYFDGQCHMPVPDLYHRPAQKAASK
ncbi:MAG: bactofilin family protein, partial [Limisphaerales bacterium]